ncbi:3-keto-disaccharide hydrolase [Bremerella sp. T1]|uniref:3-keto-disaccharide hydrolase n=1 Tax=Bremerella sp. TYQ1 TaxID=3119568 RepID=UPI001CCA3293|nr:DUF1080 domain-containing protein [Bremerella volcania]UBM37400.1 DUF1080 domain-containing protein [Bremerella volcania]
MHSVSFFVRSWVVFCVSFYAVSQAPQLLRGETPEWQSLFNGKDLSGWQADRHPANFTVVDGTLRACGTDGMSHLFYAGDTDSFVPLKNFELEVVCRGEKNSNSGIFFHTSHELRKGRYLNEGYELQLNSSDREKRKTGSLYAVKDLAESPVDETSWFTVRLRVEGKRIQVWLNDTQTQDYTEPENPVREPGREKRLIDPEGGAIALQAHDPESTFYFRSIRLKRLP